MRQNAIIIVGGTRPRVPGHGADEDICRPRALSTSPNVAGTYAYDVYYECRDLPRCARDAPERTRLSTYALCHNCFSAFRVERQKHKGFDLFSTILDQNSTGGGPPEKIKLIK